ncbi:hypothetical protein AB0M95_39055 [Sphaerisporangium sp. NPDC051017]
MAEMVDTLATMAAPDLEGEFELVSLLGFAERGCGVKGDVEA